FFRRAATRADDVPGAGGHSPRSARDEEHQAEPRRGPHGQDDKGEHVLAAVEVDSFAYRGHGGARGEPFRDDRQRGWEERRRHGSARRAEAEHDEEQERRDDRPPSDQYEHRGG